MQVPLKLLVQHVCDDGSDLDDGLTGYVSGSLTAAGELILYFGPLDPPEPSFNDGNTYEKTVYTFRLVKEKSA